jgi:hypothetical protein
MQTTGTNETPETEAVKQHEHTSEPTAARLAVEVPTI